eukprot:TRINITY_DN1729_c0_g1_i1.p1 TRINITY_DN1729_c0_g1~~TRINITY_DN1729_c0_g1_i1.p1  ORF type:complete len:340 (+),score=81.19 TRINITY_DN1729_c0_g1_i1:40-1059(+)
MFSKLTSLLQSYASNKALISPSVTASILSVRKEFKQEAIFPTDYIHLSLQSAILANNVYDFDAPDDVLFKNLKSDVEMPYFYVTSINNEGESFICIRGTDDAKDILSDLRMRPVQMNCSFHDNDVILSGHEGMLNGGQKLSNLIPDSFLLNPDLKRLYIVGHSLGAGVGAWLSVFLEARRFEIRSRVIIQNFGFAVPASIHQKTSPEVFDFLSHNSISFIIQSDPVASASYHGFVLFDDLVRDVVAETNGSAINSYFDTEKRDRIARESLINAMYSDDELMLPAGSIYWILIEDGKNSLYQVSNKVFGISTPSFLSIDYHLMKTYLDILPNLLQSFVVQ